MVVDFLKTSIFTPFHQLKVELKLFIWLYRRFTSCLFVSRYFYRKVTSWTADVSQLEVEKLCQQLSHRDKRFVLLLKTHFGHKQHFKIDDKLFTSL